MIKKVLLKVSHIGNLVLAWFNFWMFFAMRPCWSGISKTLRYEDSYSSLLYNLPIIIWILLFLIAVSNSILFLLNRKKRKKLIFLYI